MQKRGEETNPTVEFYATVLQQQLLIKHHSWSHEKEYRILYPNTAVKGLNVPLQELGLKTSRIIAGMNCSSEHLERLNKIAATLNCLPILQTKISQTEYTLLEEK